MKVLVTGGHGSIGRFVVEELVARGHDVTVFDIQEGSTEASFIKGDITDERAVNSALEGHDAVVHLAALLPPDSEEHPERAERINIRGTLNVLDAATRADARALVTSSKAVYGHVAADHSYPEYEPLPEDVPTRPMSVYGITKAACERFCKDYAWNRGLDVACLRFASTYGPGKIDEYGDHSDHGNVTLISQLIETAASGDSIVVSGGDERNDYLYYADIGNGFADALEAPTLNYSAYNLGTGQLATLGDFADVLQELRPECDITVEGGLDPYDRDHPRYCRMDIARARADFGFSPRFTRREAIQDYLDRIE